MPPPKPVELNIVLGILRLAHKYDVRYLFLRALEHLSVRYGPSSLEEYRSPKTEDHLIYDSDKHLRFFSIIRAATEVGALWLLPIPYYLASRYTRTTLRSKIDLGAQEHVVGTCLAAQVELLRYTVKSTVTLYSMTPDSECENDKSCNLAKNLDSTDLLQILWQRPSLSPLDMAISLVPDEDFCHHCTAKAKACFVEITQEVWMNLPEMFDLPSWEALKATRVAVMEETGMSCRPFVQFLVHSIAAA